MAMDPQSPSETTVHIFKIVRFAILCTLGLAAVMLFADLVERNVSGNRFLSETVLTAIVYATDSGGNVPPVVEELNGVKRIRPPALIGRPYVRRVEARTRGTCRQ